MRIRTAFRMLVFALSMVCTYAANIKEQPVSFTQPDGSLVNCYVSGDEYYNYYHDKDGYAIVQSEKDGYYYYAVQNGDKLFPSSEKVNSTIRSRTVGLAKNPVISKEGYLSRVKDATIPNNQRLTDPVEKASGVLQGNYNNLAVLIRFADQTEFTTPRSVIEEKFNSPTTYSMKSFFKETSYNKLDITTLVLPKVTDQSKNLSFKDKYPRSYYAPYNIYTNPNGYKNEKELRCRRDTLFNKAMTSVIAEIPTTLNIDSDNDGKIDNVSFIIRGTVGGWSEFLWPQKDTYFYAPPVTINGKKFYTFTKQPEVRADTHTLTHEMFHVLGAPDLYNYNPSSYTPVGPWDPMDQGVGHMLAFMKHKYTKKTWISSIPEITTSGTYTLNPITSATNNCYKISTPASEALGQYYMVEFRKKGGILESELPGSGLIVYRININGSYDGNAMAPPDEIYVYRQNGDAVKAGNPNLAYFSAENGKTEISNSTNPAPFLYSEGALGPINLPGNLRIYDIGSAAGSTISFKVEMAGGSGGGDAPVISVDNSQKNASYSLGSTVTLKADVVGANGNWIADCQFYVDNVKIDDIGYNGTGHFETSWNTAGLTAGKHTIKITSKDGAGVMGTLIYDLYLTLLSESFEGTFPPAGWTAVGWESSKTMSKSGVTSAYALFNHTGEAVLTTPTVKPTSASFVEFFWANADYPTPMARAAIKDSTFFEIYDGTKWIEAARMVTSDLSKVFNRVIVDLTPYINKNIKFRWRDRCDGTFDAVGTLVDAVTINNYPTDNTAAYFNEPDAGTTFDQSSTINLEAVCGKTTTKAVFYVDGLKIGEDSSVPYSLSYSAAGLTNGPHEFKAEFYNNTTLAATCLTPITIQNSSFVKYIGYSPNGYGWSYNNSKRISFEPASNSVVSVYRKMSPDSAQMTGNLTTLSGNWNSLKEKVLLSNEPGAAGARLMSTFSTPGYHFAISQYTQYGDTYLGGVPVMAVYNSTTNSWSDTIVFRDPAKKVIPNAYFNVGVATKDANGKLHLFTAWQNSGNEHQNQSFIHGESSNGLDWTFGDFNTNFLAITDAYTEAYLPKLGLTSSGFGVAMARIKPLNLANGHAIGFCYTEDFGKTMIFNQATSGKYFVLDNSLVFSNWLNKTAGGLLIDNIRIGKDYDLTISDAGEVHFLIKIEGQNRASGKIIQKLDNGTPVSGMYDIVGKKSGSTFTWTANFIAYNVGWGASDETNPKIASKLETNSGKIQIGTAGSTLYAVWLDRPHKYTVPCDFYNENIYEIGYTYKNDAYFSYSTDGGKSWKHDPLYSGELCGANITGTSSVTEDAFGISAKGVINNNKLDFYTTYQYAILGMPIWPTNSLSDHRQKLYLRKYTIDLATMRALYNDETSLENEQNSPAMVELFNNYPNPFNPTTEISFSISQNENIKLTIFNAKGEEVAVLANGLKSAGKHRMSFDGSRLNSGVYFYKLDCAGNTQVRKMVLVK